MGKPPTSLPVTSTKAEETPVAAAPGGATPPGPLASASPDRSIPDRTVDPKLPPPLVKSPRWTWIHDAALPVLNRWIDSIRQRGYRPIFVNGHDLATHVPLKDGPDVPGAVRIAAVAVKDGRHLPFEVNLVAEEKAFDHYAEMGRRGYQLFNMTTFTNGTLSYVLAVYIERQWGTSFWGINHTAFPEPFLSKWLDKGDRPFSISGRPQGDFWSLVAGGRDSRGVPWQIRHELCVPQLRQALADAKADGFRPESLFVCPGNARGGFGVVLTHDQPDLLWEVRIDLPATQLESDFLGMAARGYALDQVVGYASGGASRYLVCWTRDPHPYPATGWGEPSLEAIDEALEQLLVERRVPACTFAAFRNGRLVLSRGYDSADPKIREPIAPEAALPLGDLSVPLAAAAVRSLIAKKNLREDTLLSDVLRAPPGGSGAIGKSPATGSERLEPTIANLLDSVNPSARKLGEDEREALAALVGVGSSPPVAPVGVTDLELRGAILGRVLEVVTGKPPEHVIASEVLQPLRLTRVTPAPGATESGKGLVPLMAPATEVGRFFVRHQFDGRPLTGRVKLPPTALIDRDGDSMALALRTDDSLFVVLLKLPGDAPPDFIGDLRACFDRAVDPLPSLHSTTTKRRPPPR